MRFVRFGLLICLFLLALSGRAQQSQQSTTPTPAPQDPQAVSVLNQALAVAGGAPLIKTISDYTATGNVTYHWNPEAQGPVTIRGFGLGQIRIDANLPSGTHSEAILDGQTTRKTVDGKLWQYPPSSSVPSSDAMIYQPPLFPSGLVIPHMQLAVVLNSPRYSIIYKGIVQVDGKSAHDVQVQGVMPGQAGTDSMTQYHLIDFFIDQDTFQVVMTQDNVPKNIVHQVRYSNYAQAGGVLVPFSISERMGGQNTRDFELTQINFNTGLQDSAFVIQ